MSPLDKDIDRPLGLSPREGGPRPSGFSLDARTIGTALAAVVIFAASGAIALRERPFRTPEVVAVAEPAEAAPAGMRKDQQEPANASLQASSDSPSIIKVNPPAEASGNGAVIIRDPSAVGQNLRVAHLPDRALLEESPDGPLPVRAPDGRRPLDVYARPWSGARGVRVAIVIGGLGLSQTGTQAAIAKLPSEITLAFAPQGNSLGRWMQTARREGHEIVMQVPLEPFDYPNVDPGRNTLTVEASAEENIRKLRWALSRTTNYTGVMNYMGARFTADSAAMQPIMSELAERGLLYLDDGSSARSVAPELALKSRVPFAAGDAAIDAVRDRVAILKKLDDLERTARAKGFAIGTGNAFDVTVDVVTSWAAEAKRRGIEIVPISALANDPERE